MFWVWVTVAAALLFSATLAWIQQRQQRILAHFSSEQVVLGLARVDLATGYLHIALAGPPEVPFDRQQGLALIDQAAAALGRALASRRSLAALEWPLMPDEVSAARLNAFAAAIDRFGELLAGHASGSSRLPAREAELRVAFLELGRLAEAVDEERQADLARLLGRNRRLQTLVLGGAGLLLALVCAAVYVGERSRRRIEAALGESEERYRLLLETSADAILLAASDGSVLGANHAACGMLGRTEEELCALGWAALVDPADSRLAALVEEGIRTGRARGELTLLRRDGTPIAAEIASATFVDRHGASRTSLVVRDVTSRARAEAALTESEERYRVLLERSSDAVLLTAPDGSVLTANPAACEMLGRTEAEICALGRAGLVDPSDPRLPALIEQRARTGRASGELNMLRRDGTRFPAEISTSVFVDRHGARRTSMIIRDVTERRRADEALRRLLAEVEASRRVLLNVVEDQKRAEEALGQLNADLERRVLERTAELQAANEELDGFAYAVSHDLRAPLRAMSGFSLALLEDYGERLTGEARLYLDQIRQASRNMGMLVDGLLALSRSTRGDLERESVDLSALASRLCQELGRGDPSRNVEWRVEEGMTAWGDARMLEAVMRNLLGNAWKYTAGRPDARITIGTEVDAERLYWCVADNGAGFDPRHADRLFKPFQRLHRQDEFPGIGIGLATVQRVIKRHGGIIDAKGAVGGGATFRFHLPSPGEAAQEV